MCVYRVKSRGIPGQYAYEGNIINIGQKITEVVCNLSRTPDSSSTIVARREGSSAHLDFYVRRNKVLSAHNFFKNNNPLYADIRIDNNRASQVPLNRSLYEQIPTEDIPELGGNKDTTHERMDENVVPHKI